MNVGLYQSAASLSALERWQDIVSQNISSAQTAGYRKRTVQFSTQLAGMWNLQAAGKGDVMSDEIPAQFTRLSSGISFSSGETQPTRRELDVAIQGEGFFEIRGPEGQKLYTRNGEFRVTAERTLVHSSGLEVMTDGGAPITLQPGGGSVTINPDGSVQQGGTTLGKLAMVKFGNPAALQPTRGGMFLAMAGAAPQTVERPELIQGYLEQSNVQPLREMVDLVLISRAYEANQKVISSTDDQMDKALKALG
jgi:flagellar basal-body rod protein FlgF